MTSTGTPDPQPPAPVEVQNADPILVTVHQEPDEVVRVATAAKVDSQAATVKAAADVEASILRTEDQRRISGIWERTQQAIALSVVEATLLVILIITIRDSTAAPTALAVLFGLANLVIGFYFGRTNHQRVGGTTTDRDDAIGR